MSTLRRKLVRDLSRMLGQALTIAVVVACGIASFVTLRTAYASLLFARDAYYESARFADVFAHAKRAPESVRARIEAIDGVAIVETRLVEAVSVPIEGLTEPAAGRILSLDRGEPPRLNALYLRTGRLPAPGHTDEVVVLETFTDAHGLTPGDRVPVIVNGVLRRLRVVGTALSPEYVIAMGGASGQELAPDNRRFCVMWMDRDALAAAFDLKGAFDDVSLKLEPGASARAVRDALDEILAPYGGLGAVARERQPSAYFVDSELTQLESYATIAPMIFLGVAAFLVNVVLARLVHLQRPQIATLKALGYADREIGWHYLSIVLVIVAFGAVLGVALGAWMGKGMLGLYTKYYHFPELAYRVDPAVVATGVAVSVLSAGLGGLSVVWRAVRLPAAEAMQPEMPPKYERSFFERLALRRVFGTSGLMVVRELTRRPLRTALSCLGIAFGVACVVLGGFTSGALDLIIDLQFERAQREDMSVSFKRTLDGSATRSLAHLPGVLRAESLHMVPVRVRKGHRARDTAVVGLSPEGTLRRVVEYPFRIAEVPETGALLGDSLARALGVTVGDTVTLEVLDGDRRIRDVRVSALAHEMFGLSIYMSRPALEELLDTPPLVSSALLAVDPRFEEDVAARLKEMPEVATISRRREVITQFRTMSAESMSKTAFILTLFGCAISIAVVYNNARIALSMRSRDLASLRVLGFTRREISTVFLGELAAYVALALGPGLLLGKGFMQLMMSAVDQELYRMPAVVTRETYLFAAMVTLASAVVSGIIVRRKLDHLDLVGVLKARE